MADWPTWKPCRDWLGLVFHPIHFTIQINHLCRKICHLKHGASKTDHGSWLPKDGCNGTSRDLMWQRVRAQDRKPTGLSLASVFCCCFFCSKKDGFNEWNMSARYQNCVHIFLTSLNSIWICNIQLTLQHRFWASVMIFFSKTLIFVESNLLAPLTSDGATFYKTRLVFGCDGWRWMLGDLHVADADVGVQTRAAYVASLGSEQLCHGVLASPKKIWCAWDWLVETWKVWDLWLIHFFLFRWKVSITWDTSMVSAIEYYAYILTTWVV